MTKSWLDRIEKRVLQTMETPGHFAPFSFDQVLAGCASLYKAGVRLRYGMYGSGFFKARRLDCPVISIGNLAVGGSGKTPMAVWLAKMLMKKGLRPVVISRGYRGTLEDEAAVVSDGREVFLDAKTCGDEPYMMAMEKAFPVVVGKDRYKAGLMAVETFAPDVIILDDGFQHLKLSRDLNLVLLDYKQPLGNGRMLPAGRLRETLCMAKDRIDAVVFTRCPPDAFQLDAFQETGSRSFTNDIIKTLPSVPVFFCTHEPFVAQLFPAESNNNTKDFKSWNLKGKTAVLFSGLARNASFAQSVQDLGVNVADHFEFCDHYRYNEPDFKRISARAEALNADFILTTQKDWVKVNPVCFRGVTVAVIGIRLRFSNPQGLEKFILNNRKG
ncbi:tetraacyldisaccharide 4'-kinase [Desulfobacter hydrogenophilus]|uniref:Tetraacyldisaccharide 4'-kinase n=1 Tax=Desulfobacter hydrogenophilus TaxID=2291 RepID=A0A328FDB0_9BACT|nr:tetraacyldisaccharide 4'-kinase [Desulfobacter hydrogenophilus]NDY72475.1 tetraacyldisaccharide 4'-kinase [Desulfobacter hydrogenophilus]QBH13794.1 tetraacyldisaccharide 4'-kinase [Desulfobacter hydrogenophilus]RAM01740.1 tetraacyldisaccharide 4'-kinase [Desulfobacter hydrogenophilus]